MPTVLYLLLGLAAIGALAFAFYQVTARQRRLMAELTRLERLTAEVVMSAEAVLATRDVPHLPSARIDGYPLAAAATFGASAYNPLPLDMGVRAITAGAPMPPGTDAVLPFMAAAATGDFIEAAEPVAPGDGVELAGAVWRRGDVVLPAGRRLSALDIACAASAQRSGARSASAAGSAAAIRSAGSVSMMTPVENGSTCAGSSPRVRNSIPICTRPCSRSPTRPSPRARCSKWFSLAM